MIVFLWLVSLGSTVTLVLTAQPGWLLLALVFGSVALYLSWQEDRRSRAVVRYADLPPVQSSVCRCGQITYYPAASTLAQLCCRCGTRIR